MVPLLHAAGTHAGGACGGKDPGAAPRRGSEPQTPAYSPDPRRVEALTDFAERAQTLGGDGDLKHSTPTPGTGNCTTGRAAGTMRSNWPPPSSIPARSPAAPISASVPDPSRLWRRKSRMRRSGLSPRTSPVSRFSGSPRVTARIEPTRTSPGRRSVSASSYCWCSSPPRSSTPPLAG